MRQVFHSLPTLAVSIAVLAFVTWMSVTAGARQSLYAERSPSVSTHG